MSMEVSRQESWSGLPCPPPGALPNPGIELGSPALQADSLPSEPASEGSSVLGAKGRWGMPLSLKKCSGGHRYMVNCSFRAVDVLIEAAAGFYGRREGSAASSATAPASMQVA